MDIWQSDPGSRRATILRCVGGGCQCLSSIAAVTTENEKPVMSGAIDLGSYWFSESSSLAFTDQLHRTPGTRRSPGQGRSPGGDGARKVGVGAVTGGGGQNDDIRDGEVVA
jgi:hypothetical protein